MAQFDAAAYWENRLADSYDLQGVGYSSLGRFYNRWMYRVRQRVFRRLICSLNLDFKNTAVLDLGSGTGFYIEQWNRLGVGSITGVDITTVAVQELKRKFPQHSFYQADVGAGLREQGTYDVVTAFDVLFHIVNDDQFRAAIRNSFDALRLGGFFLFSDNFVHAERAELAHQVSRPLDAIEKILIAAGFHIVQRVPMFSLMNAPVDCSSTYRKRFWNLLTRMIRTSEVAGFAIGAILYPVELWLTRSGESPSTEVMICRRPLAQ